MVWGLGEGGGEREERGLPPSKVDSEFDQLVKYELISWSKINVYIIWPFFPILIVEMKKAIIKLNLIMRLNINDQ